jgi:hypothetical protein
MVDLRVEKVLPSRRLQVEEAIILLLLRCFKVIFETFQFGLQSIYSLSI